MPRKSFDSLMEHAVRQEMKRPGEELPEMGDMFRNFERDALSAAPPRVSVGRVLGWTLGVVGALVCVVLFWLLAVLMDAPLTPPAPGEDREASRASQAVARTWDAPIVNKWPMDG